MGQPPQLGDSRVIKHHGGTCFERVAIELGGGWRCRRNPDRVGGPSLAESADDPGVGRSGDRAQRDQEGAAQPDCQDREQVGAWPSGQAPQCEKGGVKPAHAASIRPPDRRSRSGARRATTGL